MIGSSVMKELNEIWILWVEIHVGKSTYSSLLVTILIVKGLVRREKISLTDTLLIAHFLLGNSRFGKCLKGNSQNCKELQRGLQHVISLPHFCVLFLHRVLFKNLEAVTRMCFVKKVFLKISQNSQENTCTRVSF